MDVVPWLASNWYWLLVAFYAAEKIVKLTPTKYDDILIDIVWATLKKAAGKEKIQ